ncbi:hypothetical protein QBC33DRAFT_293450 [Phialemonium atrogriseum]|uniref:Circumsporozoite protein n=1 Tax=Phialemonium atrogriseum TaxID=1093897 RepID=A0AAJ0FHF6_9PEZI|nr:uncharacterized protein QBC33DRAFT_293450 [Phialemonium atrogriseum]KAK1762119.1 hypothetical protein QBC33DRAFT_293450 [Phialemonium atrogriseum]
MSKAIILSALLAFAEARFGQEGLIQNAISSLGNFGNPGEAATLAGGSPGVLLGGANACAKLELADKIVATLGNDPAVIAAAAQLVAAEKNFNPFAAATPVICSDASLPVTVELRGIVPLVDPDVLGSDIENANSATSLKTPFNAAGLSVADVMAANGFSNFTTQGSDGAAGAAPAAAAGGAAAAAPAAAAPAAVVDCGAGAAAAAPAAAAPAAAAPAAAAGAAGAVVNGVQQSTIAGLDFGLCVPTVKFEPGLNGRKDTEFTFQAIDPIVNKGQQEALNPAIIFNRICDQLGNVCEASDAAKAACEQAKADLSGGDRNAALADAWNTQLGFAGTDINPDNAPQAGLIGHS